MKTSIKLFLKFNPSISARFGVICISIVVVPSARSLAE